MWNSVFYNNYKSSYGSGYLSSRTQHYTNPNSPIAKQKGNSDKDSFKKTILTATGITIAGLFAIKNRKNIAKIIKSSKDFFAKLITKK